MSFADEFKHETPILHAALEAAVGPLPEAELLGLGRVRVGGTLQVGQPVRYFDPIPGVILAEARVLLAAYVQACRTLVKVDRVEHDADGIHVTGTVPDPAVARVLRGDTPPVSLASRLAGPPPRQESVPMTPMPRVYSGPTAVSELLAQRDARVAARLAENRLVEDAATPPAEAPTALEGIGRWILDAVAETATKIQSPLQATVDPYFLADLIENDPDLDQADLPGMLAHAVLVGRGEVIYPQALDVALGRVAPRSSDTAPEEGPRA